MSRRLNRECRGGAMNQIAFRVGYNSRMEADTVAAQIRAEGVNTEVKEEPGLLPLPVLLIVGIPPGVALLAKVVDRIVHGWKGHGTLIDARGTSPAIIK